MTLISKWHPAASAFPLMQGEELQRFIEDIRANGVRKPIELYDGERFPEYKGVGIDGRNRLSACRALDIDPPMKWLTDADVGESLTAYIVSLNVARRHLTSSQAATVGVAVKKQLEAEAKVRQDDALRRGRETMKEQRSGESIPQIIAESTSAEKSDKNRANESREQAAEIVGTNRQYITDAEKIETEAPKLTALIRDDKLSIPQAKTALKLRDAHPEEFTALEEGWICFAEFRELCEPKTETANATPPRVRAKTGGSDELVDQRQTPVPPELVPIFASALQMRDVCQLLAKIATLVEKWKSQPAAVLLDVPQFRNSIDSDLQTLRGAVPYCVCPNCHALEQPANEPGETCPLCQGRKWVTEGRFLGLQERMAKGCVVSEE